MQLRARNGRAVLAEDPARDPAREPVADPAGDPAGIAAAPPPAAPPREVDPHRLALGADLADALHEWARVADAVAAAEGELPTDGAATGLISRRGRQLAARVAGVMGTPVSYLDPLTGEVTEVPVPSPVAPAAPPGPARSPYPAAVVAPNTEPTPWATGLTVSGFTAVLITLAVVVLSLAIGGDSGWLALAANIVIAIGLSPSIWLARRLPVWRWVAWGVVAGLGVAWLTLLLSLL